MSEKLTKIPVNMFVFSGRNPRYEMRGLEELARNIEQYGVLQPIIVRPKENKFEVVVGERRLRAAVMAGLREVPAIVRETSEREADELRLIENIHRDDLIDAEKGDAVYALMENHPEEYKSYADVARAINKPYSTVVSWTVKSRKLSSRVRDLIGANRLTEKTALYLMKYNHEIQTGLAETIAKYELSEPQAIKFLKHHEANPKADLDELANEAKGVKKVEVELARLPPKVREEVERVVKEGKENVREIRKETARKAAQSPRRPRPKPIQAKLPVPLPSEVEPTVEFKPKQIQEMLPVPSEAEEPTAPTVEVKPRPIEEELRELLEKDLEKLTPEPFTIREEAFKRIRRVLEEPVPAREERKMVKEIDTGIIEECSICHKKLRIIHYEPPYGHKCEEVSE